MRGYQGAVVEREAGCVVEKGGIVREKMGCDRVCCVRVPG